MKTRQVTLPPLFSGWDGSPRQLGTPPVRAEFRAQLCRDWLTLGGRQVTLGGQQVTLGGRQVWLKQTGKGWWGLSSGWDVSTVLRHLEGSAAASGNPCVYRGPHPEA